MPPITWTPGWRLISFIGPLKEHYKVDFITFSCLLGLDHTDHTSTAITDISALAMDEYQYMYLDGYRVDGKTVWLKPY